MCRIIRVRATVALTLIILNSYIITQGITWLRVVAPRPSRWAWLFARPSFSCKWVGLTKADDFVRIFFFYDWLTWKLWCTMFTSSKINSTFVENRTIYGTQIKRTHARLGCISDYKSEYAINARCAKTSANFPSNTTDWKRLHLILQKGSTH